MCAHACWHLARRTTACVQQHAQFEAQEQVPQESQSAVKSQREEREAIMRAGKLWQLERLPTKGCMPNGALQPLGLCRTSLQVHHASTTFVCNAACQNSFQSFCTVPSISYS